MLGKKADAVFVALKINPMEKTIKYSLFILLVLLTSCQKRVWNNPFDSSCPKELWTPTDFKAVQEGTTVKLTWSQPINQISGFKILKGVDGGTATSLQDQSKGAVQLVDNTLTGGKIHLYSLTAYAGNNTSNPITAQITPVLTAGITTTAISTVTSNSVQSGGTVTTDGGAPITSRGVCWSTSQNPTIADTKTNNGTGTGNFTSSITGLTPGGTYYIRAYVTNSAGTSYGNQVTATTSAILSTITTITVTAITATTATSGGTITDNGGAWVTVSGVCWSTTTTPTIANTKTTDGKGTDSFTSAITGLTAGTTYYVRAYATNSAGTAYGNQVSFGTTSTSVTITDVDGNLYNTTVIGTQTWITTNLKTTRYRNSELIGTTLSPNTDIYNQSAPKYQWAYNGIESNVTTYGRLYSWYTVSDSRGICPIGWHVPTDADWTTLTSYLGGASVAADKLKESGTSHWLSTIVGTNSGATNETLFTALPGGVRNWSEFWGLGVNGYWWSSSDYSITNNWSNAWTMASDSPRAYPSYFHWRNGFSVRCIKGEVTSSIAPTISTDIVTNITSNSATSGGTVLFEGSSPVTIFGVCWSTIENPTTSNSKTQDGSGIWSFTTSLSGLTAGTKYYVRSYATNNAGTTYGNQVSFTTSTLGTTVSDADGNVYSTVTIGTQVWMGSNLKTTKYNDNTAIPLVTDNIAWTNLSTPGYCWYNNDATTYKNTYGALYNWYTVNTGKLCPIGWHVPSEAQWTTLTNFLGGGVNAGGKLKEVGTTHWASPNTDATNVSNFTALPGGYRHLNSNYYSFGTFGVWWSSTFEATYTTPWQHSMSFDSGYEQVTSTYKQSGISVRCLKD